MPSYYELTTYIPGPKMLLPALLEQYQQALEHTGLSDEAVSRWLTAIAWEPGEDMLGFSMDSLALKIASIVFQVRPIIESYRTERPGEKLWWYEPGLLFETEQIEPSRDWFEQGLLPEAANAVWHTMRAFAQAFPARTIFFVHEAFDFALLEYHDTKQGDLWKFGLALVPLTQFNHLASLPDTYIRHKFPYG